MFEEGSEQVNIPQTGIDASANVADWGGEVDGTTAHQGHAGGRGISV